MQPTRAKETASGQGKNSKKTPSISIDKEKKQNQQGWFGETIYNLVTTSARKGIGCPRGNQHQPLSTPPKTTKAKCPAESR